MSKVMILVKSLFAPLQSSPVPTQSQEGPLTCPAVVKLQRALDAKSLLTGGAAVPVLPVNLEVGGGEAVSGKRGFPLAGPLRQLPRLGVHKAFSPIPFRNMEFSLQPPPIPLRLGLLPAGRPRGQGHLDVSSAGGRLLEAPLLPARSLSELSAPPRPERDGRLTHLIPAVLVRNMLLQTLLAAEQLGTFLTFKQLVTFDANQ